MVDGATFLEETTAYMISDVGGWDFENHRLLIGHSINAICKIQALLLGDRAAQRSRFDPKQAAVR